MGYTHYTRMSSRTHTLTLAHTHTHAQWRCWPLWKELSGWPLIGRYYERLFHLITCCFPWICLGYIIKGHPAPPSHQATPLTHRPTLPFPFHNAAPTSKSLCFYVGIRTSCIHEPLLLSLYTYRTAFFVISIRNCARRLTTAHRAPPPSSPQNHGDDARYSFAAFFGNVCGEMGTKNIYTLNLYSMWPRR